MGFPISTEIKLQKSRRLGEFSEHGVGAAGMAGMVGAVSGVVSTVGTTACVEPTGVAGAADAKMDRARATIAPVQLGIGRGSRWIAVAGGLGYFPLAPGTAGSFGGVLLFLLAMNFGVEFSRMSFMALYGLGVGLLLVLGTRAAGRAEVDFGRRDDGRIVIDEVVGQMITFLPLTLFVVDDLLLIFPQIVTGFVLFRLFDVWKPGAVRWAERRFKGGLGVMADDVVAGLYAGTCLAVCFFVLHLFGIGVGIGVGIGIGTEVGTGLESWMPIADSLPPIALRVWA